MPQSIRDWVITVGMDTSEADTKIQALEKRIGRSVKAAYKSQAGSIGVVNRALRVQVELLRRRNALEGRKAVVQSLASRGGLAGGVGGRAKTTRPIDTYSTGRGIDRKLSRAETAIAGVGSQASTEALRLKASLIGTSAALTEVKKKLASVGADKAKFRKLKEEVDRLTDSLNRDAKALNRVTKATHRQSFAANSASHSVKNLARSWVSVFAVLAGARSAFNIGRDLQSIEAVMLAATGDAKAAKESFSFVKDEALRLGVGLKVAGSSFAKFGAAARGSGMSLEETKKLFTSISEVNLAFQLSTDRSKLAFLAFEQMLSKGTVSMEELRRQLGEQWPGAFKQAADSMGITTKELNKLVASGELMSKDFIGGFIGQMVKFVKESGAYDAALVKVATQQKRLSATFELAIGKSFTKSSKTLSGLFKNLTIIIEQLTPTMTVIGRVFAEVVNAIAFAVMVVSPILNLLATSVENVFDAIDRATSTDLDLSKLNAFEAVLRGIAIALLGIEYVILSIMSGADSFAKWLGGDDKESSGVLNSVISWTTAAWLFAAALKFVGRRLKSIWNIGKSLKKFFFGGEIAAEASVGVKAIDKLKSSLDGLKKLGKGAAVATGAYVAYEAGSDFIESGEKDAAKGSGSNALWIAAGTAIGAAIGSVIPVAGTVSGALAGATLGELGHSYFGSPSSNVTSSSGSAGNTTTVDNNIEINLTIDDESKVSDTLLKELDMFKSQALSLDLVK